MGNIFASVLSKKVALTSETTKTILQLHADETEARLIEWGISFDGTNSAHTPARVRLVQQTTGGTMTQIGRGEKLDSGTTNSNMSWRIDASAEPTAAANFKEQHLITPIGGLFVKQYPLGREPVIRAGERLGLTVYPGLGSAASCYGYFVWEE